MKKWTNDEKKQKVAEVDAYVKGGMTNRDAIAKAGINTFSYYSWRQMGGHYKIQPVSFRTEEQWQTIFQDQQQSGLTVKEFCQQNKIIYGTFNSAMHRTKNKKEATPTVEPTREVRVESNGHDKKKIQELQNEIVNLKLLVADFALDVSELKKYIGRV